MTSWHARWFAEPHARDRTIGWYCAFGGVVIILGESVRLILLPQSFEIWWYFLVGIAPAIVAVLAVGGGVLPMPVLRAAWVVLPIQGMIVPLLSFAAFRGTDPDLSHLPVWGLLSVSGYFFVLSLRTWLAVALTVVTAFLPLVSQALFTGKVQDGSIALAATYLPFAAITVVCAAQRTQLLRMDAAEARARVEEALTIQVEERARTQRELSRVVHDEVLSTLAAALNMGGEPSEVLRRDALGALKVLNATPDAEAAEFESCRAGAEKLASAVRIAAADALVEVEVGAGVVPGRVVDTMSRALAEAARNSLLHAPDALRTLKVQVFAEGMIARLADDGGGFDLSTVPTGRMGVRDSILGRMNELEGGHATVASGPDGTVVELRWIA